MFILIAGRVADTVADIDDMVGDTLQSGNGGCEVGTDLQTAVAFRQAGEMLCAESTLHFVGLIFQCCQLGQMIRMLRIKGILCNAEHLQDHIKHFPDVSKSGFGEGKFLGKHFLTDLVEVLRMVTDTLQVVEYMEIRADPLLILPVHMGRQLDKEIRQSTDDRNS